jgi:nucleotide-binding universal stress UspA family protein
VSDAADSVHGTEEGYRRGFCKSSITRKADLIVMGSYGRSALSATVLGSVSYGVIHNDKSIPVLIVRG